MHYNAGSVFLNRMWQVCNADRVCKSVYITGSEHDTFERHVVISLDTSPHGDMSGSIIQSLETLYDDANGTNDATWDRLILDLLNKLDICHHNEYFDVVTNTCICTSNTICFTPELYYMHTGLTGRIILFVLITGMLITVAAMYFRSFHARQLVDEITLKQSHPMQQVRAFARR